MVVTTRLVISNWQLEEAVLRVFGSCFNQGLLKDSKRGAGSLSQTVVALFLAYNYMVTVMYSSVVVSLLSSKSVGKPIGSLPDLLKGEKRHVR